MSDALSWINHNRPFCCVFSSLSTAYLLVLWPSLCPCSGSATSSTGRLSNTAAATMLASVPSAASACPSWTRRPAWRRTTATSGWRSATASQVILSRNTAVLFILSMLHRSNYYFNLYLKAQCVIFFRFLNQTKQENIRSAGLWELLSGNETQQSTISPELLQELCSVDLSLSRRLAPQSNIWNALIM